MARAPQGPGAGDYAPNALFSAPIAPSGTRRAATRSPPGCPASGHKVPQNDFSY